MKNRFKGKKSQSPFISVVLGGVVILIAFLLISLAVTLILYNTPDPTAQTGLYSILSFVLSGALGVFINRKLFGKDSIAAPAASSLTIVIAFLLITLILHQKIPSGNLISALCFAIATILAFLISKKKNPSKHRRR